MNLTAEEQAMLDGAQGRATQKAMQILVALGTIYAAPRLIPVSSVQIAGVSYDNLGEAGLQFLAEMADGGGRAQVLATLNPAGMDIENWPALGIPPDFAEKQLRVIDAFARMGVADHLHLHPLPGGQSASDMGITLPGRKAQRCATPMRCWGHAATAKVGPAPWLRRLPGAPLNMGCTWMKTAVLG